MIANVLDTVQMMNGFAWLTLIVCLSGSVIRLIRRQVRYPFDPLWILLWIMAVYQLGHIARWWFDLIPDPANAAETNTLLGLRVLSTMLAIALLHRRMIIEGWRW